MKKLITILLPLILLTQSSFALSDRPLAPPMPCPTCLSLKEKEIDISTWITFTIHANQFESDGPDIQLESLSISFPNKPAISTEKKDGIIKSTFFAEDEEGMVYKISSVKTNESYKTLRQFIDEQMAALKNTPEELEYVGYPMDEQTGSWGYFGTRENNGTFRRYSLVKGMGAVYILTTVVQDETYLDPYMPFEGSWAYDRIQHDSHKTYSFADSLSFIY